MTLLIIGSMVKRIVGGKKTKLEMKAVTGEPYYTAHGHDLEERSRPTLLNCNSRN